MPLIIVIDFFQILQSCLLIRYLLTSRKMQIKHRLRTLNQVVLSFLFTHLFSFIPFCPCIPIKFHSILVLNVLLLRKSPIVLKRSSLMKILINTYFIKMSKEKHGGNAFHNPYFYVLFIGLISQANFHQHLANFSLSKLGLKLK